jgi:hypothetical protein
MILLSPLWTWEESAELLQGHGAEDDSSGALESCVEESAVRGGREGGGSGGMGERTISLTLHQNSTLLSILRF